MAALKIVFLCALFLFVMALSSPIPEPGGLGGTHEHYIIHVPHEVHTVHHHHVKKVPVYIKSHYPHHYDGWV